MPSSWLTLAPANGSPRRSAPPGTTTGALPAPCSLPVPPWPLLLRWPVWPGSGAGRQRSERCAANAQPAWLASWQSGVALGRWSSSASRSRKTSSTWSRTATPSVPERSSGRSTRSRCRTRDCHLRRLAGCSPVRGERTGPGHGDRGGHGTPLAPRARGDARTAASRDADRIGARPLRRRSCSPSGALAPAQDLEAITRAASNAAPERKLTCSTESDGEPSWVP